MGDTFPETFGCLDLRVRTAINASSFVQELGRLCRYPSAPVPQLGEGASSQQLSLLGTFDELRQLSQAMQGGNHVAVRAIQRELLVRVLHFCNQHEKPTPFPGANTSPKAQCKIHAFAHLRLHGCN